ncbi:hypothetical protein ES332_A13G242500v1 [Gossypium tomentosum]|uniref:Uncharacterized protein n=1 Tax=Gossypium tomentosum TaxID=34277 RepID=A0A5D2MPA8_GOSTO|nr:hypothetical protein ES332_A13G242500v1 [Gossypium tomentosum]
MEYWKLVWVFVLAFLFGGYQSEGCWEIEKAALLQLKPFFPLINDEGISWGKGNCCRWNGVECSTSTGRVTRLFLEYSSVEVYNKDIYQGWYLNISLFLPFEELKSLNLEGDNIVGFIHNQGIKKLSKLNKLEILDLSNNILLGNNILLHLAEFTSLKILFLKNCGLEGSIDILELDNLKNLKELYLNDNKIESLQSKRELRLTKLEVLDLSYNNFNSSKFSSLAVLPHLKSLNIESNNLTEWSYIQGLNVLSNLKILIISYDGMNDFIPSQDNKRELKLMSLEEELNLWGNVFNSYMLSSLGSLSNLKSLSLYDGYAMEEGSIELTLTDLSSTSNIIRDIGTLTSLEDLVIDGCDIDANLNLHGFCELRKLQTLAIINSYWNASLPECFSKLTSLKYLNISSNNFSGNISMFKNLTSLEYLDFSSNNFSGDISGLKNLTSLEYLDLSNNNLSGDISHLKSLTSLRELRLWNNNIEIPNNNMIYNAETEMHSLDTPTFQLRSISLSCCRDGGSFPQSLNHQHDLQYVDLSNINFKGDQFPNWLLENNKKLDALYLVNSSLSGHFQLPSTSRRGLSELNVSNNSLDGNIPNEIGAKLPSLKLLNMSNNFFGDGIPISIGDMISLQILDFSNNKLSGGNIEALAHRVVNIRSLDLSNNTLFGGIPRWMGKMLGLEVLLMANNHFGGPIPVEFCKLKYFLKILDLSANNISGSLPSCFNSLRLTHVYLSRNKLRGSIIDFFNSSDLVTLDLSNNHLTGNIPNWIGGLSKLSYLLLNNNYFDGGIPVQLCELHWLRLIDVSNNNLSVLTYLSGIDLSCNKLTGPISPALADLSQIESLDLSHNNLSGNIPSHLLGLHFLSFFSVAYNNLSGTTPQRTGQFATFEESSYMGNPFLCGEPLPKNCSIDGSSSSMPKNATDKGFIDMKVFYAGFVGSYIVMPLSWFYHVEAATMSCYYFVLDRILPKRFR